MKRVLLVLASLLALSSPASSQTILRCRTTGGAAVDCAQPVAQAYIPPSIPATKVGAGTVSNSVFGYLANVTSDIQAQINAAVSAIVSLSNAAPPSLGSASAGVASTSSRSDHVHAHGNQAGGTLHADVIAGGASGFMSGTDKTKSDAIPSAVASATYAAHELVIGPTTGGAVAPTRRVLVESDIPPGIPRNSMVADIIPFEDFNNNLGTATNRFGVIYTFFVDAGNTAVTLQGDAASDTASIAEIHDGSGAQMLVSKKGIIAQALPFGDLASAATVAPTHAISRVTGTTAINTITKPDVFSSGTNTGGRITFIPAAAFTWTTAGNIALAGTAVVGRALDFVYLTGLDKWYPSYV